MCPMNVQKATIVACSLLTLFLVGYGGYAVWSNVRLPSGTSSANKPFFGSLATKEASKTSELDVNRVLSPEEKEAFQLYHYDLTIAVIGGYGVKYGRYPAATEAGWRDMLTWYQSVRGKTLLDPRTKKPLVFTTTTPGVGEVQYTTPGGCDPDKPELIAGSSRNTFAYRAVVEGSVMCYSNTGGSVR